MISSPPYHLSTFFLPFVLPYRPLGVVAVSYQMASMAAAAQDRASTPEMMADLARNKASLVHPWEAAIATTNTDSSAIPAAANSVKSKPSHTGPVVVVTPDFGAPQSRAIFDAASSLLLACLDRGRRMSSLKAMQVKARILVHGFAYLMEMVNTPCLRISFLILICPSLDELSHRFRDPEDAGLS